MEVEMLGEIRRDGLVERRHLKKVVLERLLVLLVQQGEGQSFRIVLRVSQLSALPKAVTRRKQTVDTVQPVGSIPAHGHQLERLFCKITTSSRRPSIH